MKVRAMKDINIRVLARSCWLSVLIAFIPLSAFANVKYFILDSNSGPWPEYATGAQACLVWRDTIQASADAVNPGGSTVVKQWPDENIPPNLKNSTWCVVTWSRAADSFDYYRSVYAGLCADGQILNPDTLQCEDGGYYASVIAPSSTEPGACCANPVADPVNPVNGSVYETEQDVVGQDRTGPLIFNRFYNSTGSGTNDLSAAWRHSYSRSITANYQTSALKPYVTSVDNSSLYNDPATACTSGFSEIRGRVSTWANALASYSNGVCTLTQSGINIGTVGLFASGSLPAPSTNPVSFDVTRDDGQVIRFTVQSGVITSPPSINLKLQQAGSGYTLTDTNDSVETYDANGRLLTVTHRSGVVHAMSYDTAGRLSTVTDSFGHQLTLSYDSSNRVSTVTRQ